MQHFPSSIIIIHLQEDKLLSADEYRQGLNVSALLRERNWGREVWTLEQSARTIVAPLDRWKLEDLREELAQVKEEAKEKVAPGSEVEKCIKESKDSSVSVG